MIEGKIFYIFLYIYFLLKIWGSKHFLFNDIRNKKIVKFYSVLMLVGLYFEFFDIDVILRYIIRTPFVAISLFIIFYSIMSLRRAKNRFDYIILLGKRLKNNGEIDSVLKNRIEKALSIYINNKNAKIILCGGSVHNSYSESEEMCKYFIRKGVPKSSLIVENESFNTKTNLIMAFNKIEFINEIKTCVITSIYHCARVKFILICMDRKKISIIGSKVSLGVFLRSSLHELLTLFVKLFII